MSALHYTTPLVRSSARLERLVLALGLCLPVPLLAATGLSLPMPAVVERLAAALVPWADDATEALRPAAATTGSIVRAPGEPELLSAAVTGVTTPAATQARVPLPRTERTRDGAVATPVAKRLPPSAPRRPSPSGTATTAPVATPTAVPTAAAEPNAERTAPAAPERESPRPVTASVPPVVTPAPPPRLEPIPTVPSLPAPVERRRQDSRARGPTRRARRSACRGHRDVGRGTGHEDGGHGDAGGSEAHCAAETRRLR